MYLTNKMNTLYCGAYETMRLQHILSLLYLENIEKSNTFYVRETRSLELNFILKDPTTFFM